MSNSSYNTAAKVRIAAETDSAALVELNKGLFSEDAGSRDPFAVTTWDNTAYIAELIADGERNVIWTAEVDGRAVGYLVGRLHDPIDIRPVATAVLESMYVDANCRDTGVGSALVRAFLDWARESGAGRATVNAYADNSGALRFYQRLGFQPRSLTLDMAVG